jgi:ferredoxin, 2Fe-2S
MSADAGITIATDMKISVKNHSGSVETLECESGTVLMRVLAERGLVDAICGGECSCATCQVYVDGDYLHRLPAQSALECELLEGLTNASASSRLSCQITLADELNGMGIEIAQPG